MNLGLLRKSAALAVLIFVSLLSLINVGCSKHNSSLTSNIPNLDIKNHEFSYNDLSGNNQYVRIVSKDAGEVTLVEVYGNLLEGKLIGEIKYDSSVFTPVKYELSDELEDKTIALTMLTVRDAVPFGIAVPKLAPLTTNIDNPLISIYFSRIPFSGVGRVPSAVPVDGVNRVHTLLWVKNQSDAYDISWNEKNIGDYDLPDITPIAQRYLNKVDDNSEDLLDITVDGDGDGEVGISDITPIAQNYLNTLEGYRLYRKSSIENVSTLVTDIPRELTNGEGVIPTYTFTDTTAPTDRYVSYEVRPYALGVEGVSSARIQINPEEIEDFFAQVLDRDITTMTVDEAAQLFVAYIMAFGGPEIGALDENGVQLNSTVVGEASYSLRPEGARNLAERLLSGETVKLGNIAQSWTEDLVWTETPSVAAIISWIQASLDDAWAHKDEPASMAIIMQFHKGESIPASAPILTTDTELDPFQYFFLNLSFLRWVETDGKATTALRDWVNFYPNYRGTQNDASFQQRLYEQWASIPFTTKVIGAVAGAGVSTGLGYWLGGAVSIPAVVGSASFALLIAPPLLLGAIIVNEVMRDVSIPKIVQASVNAKPITEGGKLHSVWVYFQTGANQAPNPYAFRYRLWRSTGADSDFKVVSTSDSQYSWGDDIGPNVYGLYDGTAEAGEAYIYKVDRVDIGAFWNTTSERSDGVVVKIPSGPVILGLVHLQDGTPIGGIRVSTTDGTKTFSTTTNGNGQFRLLDVPEGPRIITFRGRGFGTVMEQVLVANRVHTLDITLPNYVGDITQPPAFIDVRVEQSPEEITSGIAHIVGQATNLDGPKLILVHNGEESLFQIDDDNGNFDHKVVLNLGENKIRVRAVNGEGETMTDEFIVIFQGEFAFRATLTWGAGQSDIDLHTYSPSGHSWYGGKTIAEGSLDVDNTSGYGPENFTCTTPADGTYRIDVVYYADHDSDNETTQSVPCNIRVIVNPNTPEERTSNYAFTLTVDDETWTACTVTITGGIASVS